MIYLMSSQFNPKAWPNLVEHPLPAPEFKELVDKAAAVGAIVSCCVPADGPIITELNRRYALQIGIPVRPPEQVKLAPRDSIIVMELSPRTMLGKRGYEMANFRFWRYSISPEI